MTKCLMFYLACAFLAPLPLAGAKEAFSLHSANGSFAGSAIELFLKRELPKRPAVAELVGRLVYGELGDLEALLPLTSWNPREAAWFYRDFAKIYSARGEKPILNFTLKMLRRQDLADDLLLVFLPEGSEIRADAFLFRKPANLTIARVAEGPSQVSAHFTESVGQGLHYEQNILAAVIGYRPLSTVYAARLLVSTLFHELTHYGDFQLLSHWLLANARLPAAERDDFFKRFVAVKRGKIVIDKGFYYFFLESRAHLVQVELEGLLSENREDIPIQKALYRAMAKGSIESQAGRKEMQAVLDFLKTQKFMSANPSLLLDQGVLLGQLMETSIKKGKCARLIEGPRVQ